MREITNIRYIFSSQSQHTRTPLVMRELSSNINCLKEKKNTREI